MYMVYVEGKDEYNKPTLLYAGMKRTIPDAKKKIGRKRGYIQNYTSKRVVYQNMLKV